MLSFLVSVVVLSFGPTVAALLFAGPLGPWEGLLTWLWRHGEISLPLIAAVVGALAIPRWRRALNTGINRTLDIVGQALGWMILAWVGIGFLMWLAIVVWVWVVPGLK